MDSSGERAHLPGMRWIIAAACGSILLCTSNAAQDRQPLPAGAQVPPVQIRTLADEPADLQTWVGRKPVLIEFWATWCGACKRLEPRMEAAHRKFGSRVEFIIIAVDAAQSRLSVRQHLDTHPLHGRVLWDHGGAADRAFRPPGTGYIVLVNSGGRVVYSGAGPSQDLDGALEALLANDHPSRRRSPSVSSGAPIAPTLYLSLSTADHSAGADHARRPDGLAARSVSALSAAGSSAPSSRTVPPRSPRGRRANGPRASTVRSPALPSRCTKPTG
jgi:thiol-disulfide isomerase/thioredoxin